MDDILDEVVGVWEMEAPLAPFAWHMMMFTPFGTVIQSNPHEGNRDDSDSSGMGVWRRRSDGMIAAKFVEFKADRLTGKYIGKGVIMVQLSLEGDVFRGDSQAYRYDETGKVIAGPLSSPVVGRRVVPDEYFSKAGERAVADPLADIFKRVAQYSASYAERTGQEFLSLAAGAPDDALMPTDLYAKLAVEVLATPGRSPLNYTMPQGLPLLRGAMEQLLKAHGVVCDADSLLVTSGGMEALSLGAGLCVDAGDVVIAEGPGFGGVLSVLEMLGAKIVQISCGETGMTPGALEAAIRQYRPKLVSLMPDYQNPTGAVMPLDDRRAVAELLKRYDLYALEDGAYSLLSFEGEPLPPLQSFAPERVLYATSVSKILAPAMRVGVLVAPGEFAQKAADMKSAYNMQASAMHQAVTAQFLAPDGGYLAPRLKQLRVIYKTRRDALMRALERYFPEGSGYIWTRPSGGMFAWLTGPETVDFTQLFPAALENGLAYVPGSKFYAAGAKTPPHNSARLNFASTPEDKLDEAVGRLATVLGLG